MSYISGARSVAMKQVCESFLFFLQIGLVLSCFGFFLFCYRLMFPEIEKGNLVNPLQVIAQLLCFFFLFKYPKAPVRVRHLLLLCFFLSLLSTLYLQGICLEILFFVFLFYLSVIYFFPLDYALFLLFFVYFVDEGTAKWGFYLAFQQFGYFVLSFFLEKEQSCPNPKKDLVSFLCLLIFQLLYGFFYYQDFYLIDPLKLASLLSGACIIFISLKRRTGWELTISFCLYLLISLLIGVYVSPSETRTIWGIPSGIFIFLSMHFCFVFGLLFFWSFLPRRKQALVPLFFSALFFLLGSFSELERLEKWIEGIDLLLLILSLFSFIEEETDYQKRMTKITKANSRLFEKRKKKFLQTRNLTRTKTSILKLSSFGSILN